MADPRNPFGKADFLPKPRTYVKPVQVGGSLQSAWVGVPLAIAALALCVTIIGTARESFTWLLIGGPIAAAIAAPGVVAALILLSRQQWLEVTDDGFTLVRRGGVRRPYRDDQITGVSQRTTAQPDGGLWRWVRLDTHTEAGPEFVSFSYPVPPGQPDPLFTLVDRVVRGMATRAIEGADVGARLEGTGWHFDRHGLHVHHGPHKGVYRPDELTHVAVHDQKMCVWRGIEAEALLRVPDHTVNAHALGQVVWHFVEKRPDQSGTLPGQPLGRLLLERRGRDAALGWFCLAIALGLSSLFVPMSYSRAPLAGYIAFACLLAPLAALGLWLTLRASYLRLAFHQFGVAQPGRGRSLLYADVERMTWHANFILLEPPQGDPRPPIRFSTVGVVEDVDFAAMRDLAASAVAARWAEQLSRGPVQWTKRLRFMPGGLEYRPAGFFGDTEPVTAPYHLTSYYLLQMHMDLFVTGAPKPVVQQPLAEANFWPGLILLIWIYADLQRQREEQQKSGRKEDPRPDFTFGKGAPKDERLRALDGPERKVTPGEA